MKVSALKNGGASLTPSNKIPQSGVLTKRKGTRKALVAGK